MISSQPRYDRFDTAADMSSTAGDAVQLLYSTTQQFISQGLFTYEFQETVFCGRSQPGVRRPSA